MDFAAPFFFLFSEDSKIESRDYNSVLTQLEDKINNLKTNYERYFMGLDKIEPYTERQQVEKVIRDLLTRQFTNTAHKFRFRQLSARFNSYKQYWNRVLRKIEDGTYERDKFMMAHKDKQKEEAPKEVNLEKEKKETKEHTKEDMIKSLYNGLIEAKKKCNEDTSKINYDNFEKMINTHTLKMKKKYKCKIVDFKVVIDEGKTKLKVTPKEIREG